MSLNFIRLSVTASLLTLAAGCSSSGTSEALDVNSGQSEAAAVAPVVQANCPQLFMLDDGAVREVYSSGKNGDPERLVYQASLGDMTRACSMNGDVLTVHVMAQGRLVPGPQAKAGSVNLPIRVTVKDGDGEIASSVTQVPVNVSASGEGTQFLFSNPNVAIPNAPGGASRSTVVYLSFDQGKTRK